MQTFGSNNELEIYTADHPWQAKEARLEMDDAVYFQFDVKNLGNSNDTISLSAVGTMMSQATPTGFGWTSETLSSSETKSNYLKATVPASNDGPWAAIVTVTSGGDSSQLSTLQFTLSGVTK